MCANIYNGQLKAGLYTLVREIYVQRVMLGNGRTGYATNPVLGAVSTIRCEGDRTYRGVVTKLL